MLLGDYFEKHFSKMESPNKNTDGLFIDENDIIREISHGRRSRTYPVVRGSKGKLPEGWFVLGNDICKPYGRHIISLATALTVLELTGKAQEIHGQIAKLLNKEPEPPPPAKPS